MLYIQFALLFAVVSLIISRKLITGGAVFLYTIIVSYTTLPVLSYGFFWLPVIIITNSLIIMLIENLYIEYEKYRNDDISETQKNTTHRLSFLGAGILCIIGLIFLIVIPFFTSWSAFHSQSYHKLIGEVKKSSFSKDTSPVDTRQVRTVDQKYARLLAEKRLGEESGLGSRVEVGTLNIQNVNGKLYWVGPLNHSGFFKWLANSKGTPGYVIVSATNERDVRLIQTIKGKKFLLKYNMGNYFSSDIHRYLYGNGYASTPMMDFSFEIDDNMKPYWVITKYEKKIGYFGSDATGVITLNAITGKIQEYDTDNAPKWIDRIQPEELVRSQLKSYGKYLHGWINSLFGKKGVIQPTEGTSLVFGKNNQVYWYTGISSDGSDGGTVGFVLINTRTKETRFYKQAGATETEAQKSAEGAVQEKAYKGTFPILYNVNGVPTYFCTLKDNAGLVKRCAWINVKNYSIVGIGEDKQEALQAYRNIFRSKGNDIVPDSKVKSFTVNGTVLRIGQESRKGFVTYYLLLKETPNKLFAVPSDLNDKIKITKEGDTVQVKYNEGKNYRIDVIQFDNKNLSK